MEKSAMQTTINIFMSNLTGSINGFIGKIPGIFWILLVITSAVLVAIKVGRRNNSK